MVRRPDLEEDEIKPGGYIKRPHLNSEPGPGGYLKRPVFSKEPKPVRLDHDLYPELDTPAASWEAFPTKTATPTTPPRSADLAQRVRLSPSSPDWQPNLGPRRRTMVRVEPKIVRRTTVVLPSIKPITVDEVRTKATPAVAVVPAPKSHIFKEIVQTIVLALVIFMIINYAVDRTRVDGLSMHPTLLDKEYLITNKLSYMKLNPEALFGGNDAKADSSFVDLHGLPDRGDIIVFWAPPQPTERYIKRVIGLPGETVEVRQGVTFVNNVPLDEPYLVHGDYGRSFPQTLVGPGNVYVLGDNRIVSSDSRFWGTVPLDKIIGRATIRYWPIDTFSLFRDPYSN